MNIERFFNLARNCSKLSDYNKKNVHIGAIIVYKNKVIANGYNTSKTSPIQYKYNKYRELITKNTRAYIADDHLPTIHAEMKCLIDTKDMDIDWSKAHMFIYRESCGHTRMCKPCPSCTKALRDRGIKNIWYTTEDGFVYKNILDK